MMLELSPDDTAANAPASSMPARSSTSRSKPMPSTRSPGNSGDSRWNAVLSRSMTATSWPIRARPSDSDAPTRPHPITTTRTCRSFRLRRNRLPRTCARGTLQPIAAWAYSWHSCPSFRPPPGGWFSDRPFRSDKLAHTLLPKRIALPVFASDALSSVAYAPEEIFLVLSVAGLSAYSMAPWIGLAVAAVMLVVIASYRQNVHAYPSGGGDYEVVTTNLGPTAGLTVASALLVDYVLTVAVSMASAMSNIGSAVPFIAQHKVLFAVVAILLLASLNLRGIRESGTAFAIPTYAFMIGMYIMLGWGFFQIYVLGDTAARRVGGLRAAFRARRHRRVRAGVPCRAGVLVRLRGADRCRGHQQRGAGVPETQVAQRRNDAAAARRHRGHAVHGHHHAGQGDRRARSPSGRTSS